MNASARRSPVTAPGRIVVGIVVSFAVAACSGGAAPTATPAGAGPIATPGGAGTAPGVIDVCAAVTTARLASVFTGPVTATTEQGLTGTASGCQYVSKQFPDEEGLSIEVVTGDEAATFWTGNIPPQGQDSIPLTGIGDEAMRAAGAPDFVSIKGSIFCEAEAGSGNTEVYAGLASPDPSDHVPEDAATAFAEKLGAVCNDVFASH
jgi:hypothetical protein